MTVAALIAPTLQNRRGRSVNAPTQSERPVKFYHKAGDWLEIPGCPAT